MLFFVENKFKCNNMRDYDIAFVKYCVFLLISGFKSFNSKSWLLNIIIIIHMRQCVYFRGKQSTIIKYLKARRWTEKVLTTGKESISLTEKSELTVDFKQT